MKLKTSHILFIGGSLLLITSIILFFTGPEFIQSMLYEYKQADRGEIGDAFSGVLSPVIAWIGAVLTFFAFYIQYEANKEQRKQFEKQGQDQIFFKMLETQESRIVNSSFLKNEEEFKSYQLLELIVNDFLACITAKINLFARQVIVRYPDQISGMYLHRIFAVEMGVSESLPYLLENIEKFKSEFLNNMEERDSNQRWEYIKNHFGSVGYENEQARNVLRTIGSVYFYKVDYKYRQAIYNEVFQEIEKKYGSFLDGYLKSWEFISLFVAQSANKELYIKFLKSQFSKFEIIILFYYIASGYANQDLKDFIKEHRLMGNLHYYNGYLIDAPSMEEVDKELQHILIR